MKIIKSVLLILGLITITASLINSYFENSIRTNLWGLMLGFLLIWFVLDKKAQNIFTKFLE